MADLGSFSIQFSNIASGVIQMKRTTANSFNPKYDKVFNTPCNGIRSGVVSINGSPVMGVVVRLYFRDNGALIEQQFTKSDGSYRFEGLDPTTNKAYLITVLDPNESPPFNYTLTQDHLTALPE